ncbi:UNVERIFIED_CONTAM: hypothetical protein PYX00_008980 [Menopon gallinae]|uniref:J domain-containing protein n=1 Tax=Menopon gallinae TaxID=328185 RepID=A0AAW2H9J3_9NEOP
MAGQKFQYDESGGTFFYFLLSFLALLLIPGTCYWWPRKQKEDPEVLVKQCNCPLCQRKRIILSMDQPWKKTKQYLIKFIIILGWIILALLAYRVSQLDYEMANFDPYEILGIPVGTPTSEVRKAYRRLSVIYHPDKETGDEKMFVKLTKAYQTLTDEEAKRNFEKYGNPDGPGAMSFGIALPSWIVEKKNSVWVLGLYGLVFMVALPTVVGMWWYTSIRYSGDQVLLDTTQMYYYLFQRTPCMPLKRVIMILGASFEFDKKYNNEIIERPSDDIEVPQLIRQIPYLGEKNKERPLCFPYSIKARTLLHAHLSRMPLNPDTLDKDRQYIVKKCPYLIQEMVSCVSQLVLLAYAKRLKNLLNIETIENVMKLCPMIVQALWEHKSPLLQLPHITEDNLKYFLSKKRTIKTIQQFAQLKAEERRSILRDLSDEQFADVMKVVGKMPYVECKVRCEVIDDEATTVYTAGAIVTVTVTLIRRDMSVLFGDETAPENTVQENEQPEEKETQPVVKKPVWQKQNKKSKNVKNKKKDVKRTNKVQVNMKGAGENDVVNSNHVTDKKDRGKESDSESGLSDDEGDRSEDEENDRDHGDKKESSIEDDDMEWEKLQTKITKRDKVLEGRSKLSHTVHCPYFPQEKQEYWWVYMSDRKSRTLLTAPFHVTALVKEETVQLKFTAPQWPGLYTFTVCLRSDSYLGADQMHDIKLDVKEAPEVPIEHPQWHNVSDAEEGNEGDNSDVSEFTTDEDIEDQF